MAKPATKRTSAKPAAARPSARRTVPAKAPTPATSPETSIAGAAPDPVVVTESAPVVGAPVVRKKELVDRIVARSGLKKRDVKPAVEATLAVLGEELANGHDLNLPPLGKAKVTRTKELAKGKVVTVRLRLQAPGAED